MIAGLRDQRIFITGGTGFLGSLLLKALREHALKTQAKVSVTVLSRDPEAFRKSRPELLWPGLSFLPGDISSFQFEKDAEFDFVLHGGNPSAPPRSASEAKDFRKTVVDGTNHLFAEVDHLGTHPHRVLLLSSGAVYGPQPSDVEALRETFPIPPPPIHADFSAARAYAEAKYITEVALAEFATRKKICATIGRIFTCAGAYLPLTGRFALGQFIRSARDEGRIEVSSDGTPLRSYLAGDELAEWLVTLLLRPNPGIETFNIGSDDAISIREIAESVRTLFAERGKPISVSFGSGSTEAGLTPAPRYIPDIQKIGKTVGLKPRKSSTQAIREATEWVLNGARPFT